jgi:hypothetical protein
MPPHGILILIGERTYFALMSYVFETPDRTIRTVATVVSALGTYDHPDFASRAPLPFELEFFHFSPTFM